MAYTKFRNGFEIQTKSAVDRRIYLTKAEMLQAATLFPMLPDIYFCLCSDDGKFYIYNSANTVDPTVGKYRLVDNQVLSNTTLFETALSNSTKFTTLETKVGDAEHGLVKDVTKIQGDVTVLQTNVSTLQTNVTELRTDVNDLDTRVEELKEEVEDPESGLAKRIAQLETRLDEAEERMEEIEEWMRTIKLDNISGTLDGGEVTAQFDLLPTLQNIVADDGTVTKINYGGNAELEFTPATGYTIPTSIVVNGEIVGPTETDCGDVCAQWTRENSTRGVYGRLYLSRAIGNVSYTIVGVAEV